MNKLQATARIMLLLDHNGLLKPGGTVYHKVRQMVTDLIDRLGPDAALDYVTAKRTHFLDQIRLLSMWHKSTRKHPPPGG